MKDGTVWVFFISTVFRSGIVYPAKTNEVMWCFVNQVSTKILAIRLANGSGRRAGGRILNGVKLWFPLNNFSLLWPIHTKLTV